MQSSAPRRRPRTRWATEERPVQTITPSDGSRSATFSRSFQPAGPSTARSTTSTFKRIETSASIGTGPASTRCCQPAASSRLARTRRNPVSESSTARLRPGRPVIDSRSMRARGRLDEEVPYPINAAAAVRLAQPSPRRGGQDEPEGVALVTTRVDAQSAAHALDEPHADGEPEPAAGDTPLAGDPHRGLETPASTSRGDRRPATLDGDAPPLRIGRGADADPVAVARSVLERIGEKVVEDDGEEPGIGEHAGQWTCLHDGPVLLDAGAEGGDTVLDDVAHGDPAQLERLRRC